MSAVEMNGWPLPEGWRPALLNEVCDFLDYQRRPINETERRIRIAGKRESDLYPYFGATGQVGFIDDYIFDEPLILLAEDGGPFGSSTKPIAYSVKGKCWVNNHAHVLRPKPGVDFDYCLYALSIRPDVGDLVSGNTRPKLNQEVAASIVIPLPPFNEQKRIAAILNEQMAAVEKARAAAEAQMREFNALNAWIVRDVFEGADAGDAPLKPLRSLCLSDGQYGTSEKSSAAPNGIPVLRMGNLINGHIDWSNLVYVDTSGSDWTKYLLVKGDLLFNRTNSAELVGKTAVFEGGREAVFASYLIRFRLDSSLADSNFVAAFINSRYGRKFIEQHMTRAIGQVNISASTMHQMSIPAPDIKIQRRLADLIRSRREALESARRTAVVRDETISVLPAALLRRAFSGQL